MNPTLSILIPVRNEGLNLRIMVQVLLAIMEIPFEILVVYDSPDDQSIPVLKELESLYSEVKGIFNKSGKGVARAIGAGVKEAASDRILIFAADELGPVFTIKHMLKLMDEGCEFISCTRYAYGGKRYGGSFVGHVCSQTANFLLRLCSSIVFTDVTTGIKLFRRQDFQNLVQNMDSVGWSIAPEMAINAQLKELKLGEVPIVSIDRLFGGESTFQALPWIKAYLTYFFQAIYKLPIYKKRPSIKICRR